MKNKVLKRLIALVLTGVMLTSSTGVYNALETEENTTTSYSTSNEGVADTSSDISEDSASKDNVSDESDEGSTAYSTSDEIGNISDNKATDVSWVGTGGTGDPGSETNPYAVTDVAHFLDMSRMINDGGNALKYFKLMADINLSSITLNDIDASAAYGLYNTIVSVNPTAAEESDNVFFVLDGNNKTISGFNISDDSRNSLAIFGYLNAESSVSNVLFSNITIKSTYSSALAIGIFLKNEGSISNCRFSNVTVNAATNNTDEFFAPIAGSSFRINCGIAGVIVDNIGTFTQQLYIDNYPSMDIANNISVTSSGSRSYIGGLVAQNRGYIYKVNAKNVTVNASSAANYVGGFVGTNQSSVNSTSLGLYYVTLTLGENAVKGGNFTGGLAGSNTGRINYCSVKGTTKSSEIPSDTSYDILMYGGKTYGGITAANTGIIDKCSAIDIGAYFNDTTAEGIYGGIAGTNTYTVQNSVSTGVVENNDSTIKRSVGGVIGVGSTETRFYVGNCYTLVTLPETPTVLGSVIGVNGDAAHKANKVRNCFYSSIISGRPSSTSYGGAGQAYGDLQYTIGHLALKASSTIVIPFADFKYSGWGSTSIVATGNFRVDPTETSYTTVLNSAEESNVSFRTTRGNVSQTIYYDTNITLPAGIGSNAAGSMVLETQPLLLKTLHKTTTWTGDGTPESPYEIAAAQFRFVSLVPYASYKLTANVTLTSGNWSTTSTFWGTLDGNGYTITSNTSKLHLFDGIYGSRDNLMPQNDETNHISDPASDTSDNQKNGVVKNFKFAYNTEFTNRTSIFGDICNGTAMDITLTGTQIFYPSETDIGVAFKGVYGNSYLYNCYNDSINVSTTLDGVSGFIGTVNAANAVIDNCGSSAVVTITKNDTNYCSSFISKIVSLDGYIQNCYTSGGVKTSSTGVTAGNSNYLFAAQSVKSAKIYNCFYSPSDYYNTRIGVSKAIADGSYTGNITLWGFANPIYVLKSTGTIGVNSIYNINRFEIDKYLTEGLTQSLTSYFEVTIPATSTGYSCNNIYATSGIVASIVVGTGASENAEIYMKHNATGLVAKANILSSSDITVDSDGYYLIQKPTDLYVICSEQGTLYNGVRDKFIGESYKFKLVADIDMTGFSISAWGKSLSAPFKGTLEGELKADGTPYSITGLNINSASVAGLFGYVDGATIKNIKLDGITVNGGTYTGSLVGQIVSYANIENCSATDCNVSGSTGVGGLIGGIASGTASTQPTIIKDCSVESTTVSSQATTSEGVVNASLVGGIIGRVGGLGADTETKYATISGCSVKDCEISGNSYGVGGIVGMASNANNILSTSTVENTVLTSDTTSTTYASLGGIAGAFGGSALSDCTVTGSTITGNNASGIVTRLVNFTNTSTISNCSVVDTDITGEQFAAGILTYVGVYGTKSPSADKVVTGCSVDENTNIKSLVAGGITAVVMNYNGNVLTIKDSKSFATVTTTGSKGSKIEGAAAILGRLSSTLNTSGITITNCIAGGKIEGSASLGGVIALLMSEQHTAANKLISNCYITATISQKTLKSIKGLIVAMVGNNNISNLENICENAIYSSYSTTVAPYGTTVDTEATTYVDLNKGADGVNGITVTSANSAVAANVVSGDGTNVISLNQGITAGADSDFNIGNVPTVSGFAITPAASNTASGVYTWNSSNTNKVTTSTVADYNKSTNVALGTSTYKGRVNVYTNFSGNVLGSTVIFPIGFTVICTGDHKFDGAGTAQNPYKIYDVEDLIAIKEHHDNPLTGENGPSFYTASYMIMADINVAESASADNNLSFPSIGSETNPFKGTITSGPQGPHKISNLYISANAEGYATSSEVDFSDNYALFGYTDGAQISDIIFENATIFGGNVDAVVVGNAINTDISDVTVTGSVSIEECVSGAFVVGTSGGNTTFTDVAVEGDSEDRLYISSQGSVGGILGVAGAVEPVTMTNVSISYADIESTNTKGLAYAGALAATLSGTVTGTYTDGALTQACTVDNCTVKGIITGGAVGGGSIDSGDNNYDLTIKGVNVTNTEIYSNGTTTNSIAGGILGRTQTSYNYVIEDCSVDANTSLSAYYTAGGILGAANTNGITYDASLLISDCDSFADITQRVVGVSEQFGDTRKNTGAGGIVGLVGANANIRESITNENIFRIEDCTAGGQLYGDMNVGGIIGQFAVTQIRSYDTTDSIVENCIVVVSFGKAFDADLRYGVVVGAIEGNVDDTAEPYPDEDKYTVLPFENIFYSSYLTSNFTLFGKSVVYSYQTVDLTSTIYDLNRIMFKFVPEKEKPEEFVSIPVGILNFVGTTVGTMFAQPDNFYFEEEFQAENIEAGNLFGFTLRSTQFELESVTSSNTDIFTVSVYSESDNRYMLTSSKNGQADLVFTYKNGLKIGIPIVCGVDYDGAGTVEDPILVSSPEIFQYVVPTLPAYYYRQTADLDFSSSRYSGIQPIVDFTGHYDGDGFKLSNITMTVDESEVPVGIFGTVRGTLTNNGEVLPNVTDLIIENCTMNGGNTSSVGVLAGKVSGGATVSNVTVTGSEVTGLSPLGGAVGTLQDESKLNGINVDNTVVTATSGAAGGIVGHMISDTAVINGCSVTGSTIKSGTSNGDDVAGGIAAYAIGTVNGTVTTDENGNEVLENSVNTTSVEAYISGGAIGMVHRLNSDAETFLAINNVKVSDSDIIGKCSANTGNGTVAAGILGVVQGYTDIDINNCYVDKHTDVTSMKYASGGVGETISNAFIAIDLIDTESYATVKAVQNIGSQIVYAGGLLAYADNIDANKITMDGCVAGGNVTASGWTSYAGGAVGYLGTTVNNEVKSVDSPLFINGVLSASVFATDGTENGLINGGNGTFQYRGKMLAGFTNAQVFTDNEYFSTVVFHDNFYSSYPQDINFFGMESIDSFQSIVTNEVPFKNINVGTNFTISEVCTAEGPWNPIAIAKDLNIAKTFYAKFENATLAYGNGKVSTIDLEGFSVTGESESGTVFEIDADVRQGYDGAIGDYYEFSIIPRNYGAGQIGAAYTCGLATALPILCVEIEGNGSQETPFQITNPIQLFVVSYLAKGNYYFEQKNDIDLTNTYNANSTVDEEIINYNGGLGFNPIGSQATPFDGYYDGEGHTIKGLYINRNKQDNVGLFGYVQSTSDTAPATISNIHVELLESDAEKEKANGILGNNNVGGLVGYANGAIIDNCSVARSTVVGSDNVGALCGQIVSSTITRSFTESDAYAFKTSGVAGGIVGNINSGRPANTLIDGCFSSSNVYAAPASVSEVGAAGGIVGNIQNGDGIQITDCLFTGSTNSGHGIIGKKTSAFATSVATSVDAGQNTAMIRGAFTAIDNAISASTANVICTDVYYDSALLRAENVISGTTAMMTSELTTGSGITGLTGDNWSFANGYYPVPAVKSDDAYSVAYSKMLSLPIKTSESEEAPSGDPMFGKGIVYPVQLLQNIGTSKVTYASSIFDTTDTVAYPEGYDTKLYGVGTNKNTDLLFEDITDESNVNYGYTSVYRNIFAQDTTGTALANPTSGASLANGEIMYNLQMPVIFASTEIDGIKVYREIKVPLSYGDTYCIATQRQLFALGLATYETAVPGSKFSDYYGSDYNYKLITDIIIDENNTTLFTPIGLNDENGYTGQFDGSNHTIYNLKIDSNKDNAGMFAKVSNAGNNYEAVWAFVKDLHLVDASVSGTNYVGTLIGRVQDGNVTVSGCTATGDNGSVSATGSYVGGLIGYVPLASDIITECHASVNVTGKANSIGGLIGHSGATVTSCYATGEVYAEKLTQTCGIGGLIGYMESGTVSNSFASGNVTVDDFTSITLVSGEEKTVYGIGGFVGIVGEDAGDANKLNAISSCFSGGNVSVANNETATGGVKPTASHTGIVGVGGFSGVNYAEIINCYSSASVIASFSSVKNQQASATYGVGIGGVSGVALGNVQNVYSSGSAAKPDIADFNDEFGTCYYGVGGAIGTTMNSGASVSNCFFDSWTNTDATMTSIGDREDNETNGIRSYTTSELTSGSPVSGFDTNIWGFAPGAYPYVRDMLNETVSDEIKTNAILSVIVVEPDPEDYSARQGNGLTMALTVPTEFTYYSFELNEETGEYESREVTYNLHWEGASLTGNLAVPIRTKNISEYLTLTAEVVGFEQYGNREYNRLCADMRGTYYQPYLIGNTNDLSHMNMTTAEHEEAKNSYTGFYDQWVTPIDDQNQPMAGTVHYQLMSNIDASTVTRKFADITGSEYTFTHNEYDDSGNATVVTDTFTFDGFVLTGNGYAVQNAVSDGAYFPMVDAKSSISNIIFKDASLKSNGNDTALVAVNNGKLTDIYMTGTVEAGNGNNAGLVAVNNNLIDGCVVDTDITNASVNTATVAAVNNGTISNTGSAGSITTSSGDCSDISGFVAKNSGTVENSFAMVDIRLGGNGKATDVGGFIGENVTGNVNGCISRSSIECNSALTAGSTVASLAGSVTGGTVSNCFTAGNLGYCDDNQHSIAFGNVNGGTVSEIYVDKAMSGGTSYNSFKYATPTGNIIQMINFGDSMSEYFTADENKELYPQITTIINAESTKRVDENDIPLILEEGTIIRDYDILKSYANVSGATVITANSQYIDSLALNSNANNINSKVSSNVSWSVSTTGVINVLTNDWSLRTTDVGGTTVLTASTENESDRKMQYKPELNIKVVTGVNNPNFADGGYGTKKNPYKISTPEGLQALSFYGINSSLYFVLSKDINMDKFEFEQIPLFTAQLNSPSKKVIYNLNVEQGGVFGTIGQKAYIGNLGVVGLKVNSTDEYTGGLAGQITGATVDNVIVSGEINGQTNTGAIAGCVSGNSTITGVITSGYVKGTDTVGGAFGAVDSSVVNDVLSTAYVDGTSNVGGVAGEVVNGSTIDDIVFGGMSTGSAVAGFVENASVTDYYVDRQTNISGSNLVGSESSVNAYKTTTKLTKALANIDGFSAQTGRYYTPSGFIINAPAQGNTMFGAAVEMANIILNFRSGSGSGTVSLYSTLTVSDRIAGISFGGSPTNNSLRAEEVQYADNPAKDYLKIVDDTTDHLIKVNVEKFDENVQFTGLKVYLNTTNNNTTIFNGTENGRIFRYVTPGMVKTVNASYTLIDSTGELGGETAGILIRNLYNEEGSQVDNINIFDKVGTTPKSIDTMSVANSVNGFYVCEMLPEGYKYQITATDGNGNALTVSDKEGQFGHYIDLKGSTDNNVELVITIVKDDSDPWGVHVVDSLLWS